MTVKFWSTTGEYGCFSNFSRHPIVVKGRKYSTSEHYYQSQKFAGTDPLYENKITKAKRPNEAARLGRDKKRKLMRKDWEHVKLNVMRTAIKAKAEQHPQIKELLLSTGDEHIEEDSLQDSFWGTGRHGEGENWLGKLWMELRTELRGDGEETDDEYVDSVFSKKKPRPSVAPRVWSKRKGAPKPPKGAIYIGRPTEYGNPYTLENEEDRDEILVRYERWLRTQHDLLDKIKRELKGKDLVCWCHPLPCHGDVLLRIANEEDSGDYT